MITVATTEAALDRILHDAIVVQEDPAIFRVEGAGAVACLQGLLTSDIDQPGPGSLVYGALLTPKGMIILDLWSLRDGEGFTLIVPLAARSTAMELFRRTLPPRLARVTDRTGEWTVAWLLGARVGEAMEPAELGPLPEAGKVVVRELGGATVQVAAGTHPGWFRAVITGPADAVAGAIRNLSAAGVVEGEADDLHTSRILAGWPALGHEIGEKTLPQEVRYDELGGVSYTKGCYTGQETVARLHFRGHPNRELRGLVWDAGDPLTGTAVEVEGREVGTIRSILDLPDRRLALAPIRREVEPGTLVTAGGQPARVVALPFDAGAAAA